MNKLGFAIKEKRKKKKITQKQLAKKLGVTFNMISHWETGRRKPPVKYLLVLPQLLGGEITISKNGVYFN